MSEENKPKQDFQASPSKPPEKVPFSWVISGIAAVIIMWALSSWLFR
ncbi:MAG: hypothetical protein PHU56_03445 [Candidatus Pacebacteria bacterium]|nr:hypothetical protein [Candidatus Paceibacterota bacterium]